MMLRIVFVLCAAMLLRCLNAAEPEKAYAEEQASKGSSTKKEKKVLQSTHWTNPITKKGTLATAVSEATPFVFKGRLYRIENISKSSEFPGKPNDYRFHEDGMRIRDVETGNIISHPLADHYFGQVFVWKDQAYLHAGVYGKDKPKWTITEVVLITSDDLVNWSKPKVVVRAENGEHIFNTAVCRGDKGFVLLYETNDKRWPAFTFKYCTSDDLVNWTLVPEAVYGRDKYVGGPALYFEGGRYYTLFLHSLGNETYETRVTRSTDLIHWEDAPADRPFLTFDSTRMTDPLNYPGVREINASDAELCAWQGGTIIYFNGGNQLGVLDLQEAWFNGAPRELFESFYEK